MTQDDFERGARPGGDREEEAEVERLLREAGPRPETSAEDLAAIETAFREAWEVRLRARRVRRWRGIGALAAAAALALAVGAGWWWRLRSSDSPPAVARVEGVAGEAVAVLAPGEDAVPLRTSEGLPAGVEVRTASAAVAEGSHLALALNGGGSLRLGPDSRVRLVSAQSVVLEEGALYFDSGRDGRSGGPLEVATEGGVLRELGTQFEVRLLEGGAGVRIRVREGEVAFERSEESWAAAAGVELTVHRDGTVSRHRIAGWGSEWEWVLAAAPPLEVEGRSVRQVLAWVARETGWEVRYEDPSLAEAVGGIVVHGSLRGLRPDQAPEVVLPSARLAYRVGDGVLEVRRKR